MKKSKRGIVLVILSMIAGMVYLTPLIRFSFYDQMIVALQITDIELGTIGAIYGIFNVIGYLPSGFLAEKFNTKKLLIISTVAMCLVTVWYSTYPGFEALCVIHALFGIFSVGTFWSPYLKAIRHLGSEEEQGRLFGMSEGIRGIGQTAVAFLCLGVMGFFTTAAAGFRAALIINAVVFALLALAVVFLVPDFEKQKQAEQASSSQAPVKQSLISIVANTLKSPSTWICIFVIICGYTIWNTVNGYMGTYGVRVLGLSNEMSSALSIVRSYIIVFIAGFTGGFIIDKFKTKGKGMMLAFFAAAICAAAILFTSEMVMVCVIVTVALAYVVNVIKSTYWSIMGQAGVPLASTGMATGVISLIALTPDIFVTPIISRFLDYGESIGDVGIGFNLMLIWVVVWAVLGIVAGFILMKRAQKTMALQEQPAAEQGENKQASALSATSEQPDTLQVGTTLKQTNA